MKILQRPVMTTALFGLGCSAAFIPAAMFLSSLLYWPAAFRVTMYFFVIVYSALLCRWASVRLSAIAFPLLLPLPVVFLETSPAAFLLLAVTTLGWIRSGICFQGRLISRLAAELAFGLGGAALVAAFQPLSTPAWALGVLIYFLVQSLYFVFRGPLLAEDDDPTPDLFEQARRRAEKILTQDI